MPDFDIVPKNTPIQKDLNSNNAGSAAEYARPDFSGAGIIGDFKRKINDCHRADLPQSKQGTPEYKMRSLFVDNKDEVIGQITAYDALVLARQYRTFTHSFFVAGRCARIRRTDRAGTIITRAMELDTEEGARHFCEFLWRYSHAALEEQGFDTAHAEASAAEEQAFKNVISDNISLQYNKATLDSLPQEEASALLDEHYKEGFVSKMNVYGKSRHAEGQGKLSEGEADGNHRVPVQVLVSKPVKMPEFSDGRATRAYWIVYRIDRDGPWSPGMLKDCWRIKTATTEGAKYEELLEEGKCQHPNIPTLLAHSDMIIQDEDGPDPEDEEIRVMWEWEKSCSKCECALYSFSIWFLIFFQIKELSRKISETIPGRA